MENIIKNIILYVFITLCFAAIGWLLGSDHQLNGDEKIIASWNCLGHSDFDFNDVDVCFYGHTEEKKQYLEGNVAIVISRDEYVPIPENIAVPIENTKNIKRCDAFNPFVQMDALNPTYIFMAIDGQPCL